MNDERLTYRVVYVGTSRQRTRAFGLRYEPERVWRQRQAKETEDACQEMARRGLRLTQVVPILSSTGFQGSWTEGAWLHFGCADEPGYRQPPHSDGDAGPSQVSGHRQPHARR